MTHTTTISELKEALAVVVGDISSYSEIHIVSGKITAVSLPHPATGVRTVKEIYITPDQEPEEDGWDNEL